MQTAHRWVLVAFYFNFELSIFVVGKKKQAHCIFSHLLLLFLSFSEVTHFETVSESAIIKKLYRHDAKFDSSPSKLVWKPLFDPVWIFHWLFLFHSFLPLSKTCWSLFACCFYSIFHHLCCFDSCYFGVSLHIRMFIFVPFTMVAEGHFSENWTPSTFVMFGCFFIFCWLFISLWLWSCGKW